MAKKKAVVKAKATKKSFASKIREYYFPEDISNIPEYITYEFFIPAVFDAISDSLTNAIDMIFHKGGKRKSGKRKFDDPLGYSKISKGEGGKMRVSERDERIDGVSIFIPGTIADVKYFLDVLDEDIEDYDWISVADVYERAGIKLKWSKQDRANKYGWESVEDVEYTMSRERIDGEMVKGYNLYFPKPAIMV